MKCPKCGYHSFDHLENCKKCGNDLTDHKAKYSSLRGLFVPGQSDPASAPAEEVAPETAVESPDDDFGFDFLEEDEEDEEATTADEAPTPPQETSADAGDEEITLGDDSDQFSLDQPFDIDAESVPADEQETEKKGADSEFSF